MKKKLYLLFASVLLVAAAAVLHACGASVSPASTATAFKMPMIAF